MTPKKNRSKRGERGRKGRDDVPKNAVTAAGSKRARQVANSGGVRPAGRAKRPEVTSGGAKRKASGTKRKILGTKPLLAGGLARVLILAVALVAAYALSLGNDFVYDDRYVILNNEVVTDPAKTGRAFDVQFYTGLNYYRPIPLLTFALEYRLWGARPLGYHATNLLLLMAAAATIDSKRLAASITTNVIPTKLMRRLCLDFISLLL